MRKIRRLISNKGFSALWAVIIALISLMIFVIVMQFVRLMTISAGVKDAVQSAVISTSVGNYANVYDGIREGYSGGYKYSGGWSSAVSMGDIYGRIDDLLGLEKEGGKHIKKSADGVEYAVYGLSVNIENAPFAPSSGDISQFSATSKITLEVPLSFMGNVLPPMKVELVVKSKYTPKF